jgi:hypothetical protein
MHFHVVKIVILCWELQLPPVILATQEAEIRRITVQVEDSKTLPQKYPTDIIQISMCKCHKETPRTPILNRQKCHFFFFYIIREQEGRTSRRREDVEKGCRRVNMVQILCTHVCKWKNETC